MEEIFPKIAKSGPNFRKKREDTRFKKFRNGCSEALHGFDIFGESVKLTYKGKENFTTMPGSILSVIILITLLAFSTYRIFILVYRINPDVSQQNFLRDLDVE